jgi:hypothetical protein
MPGHQVLVLAAPKSGIATACTSPNGRSLSAALEQSRGLSQVDGPLERSVQPPEGPALTPAYADEPLLQPATARGGPRLAFLYASPLINQLRGGPVDLLDFKTERDTLVGAIRSSGKRVEITAATATTRNLSNLLLDGCRVLHYSGHGFTALGPGGTEHSVLAFEDGLGGTHPLEVGALQQLVAAGARRTDGAHATLDLAFISACHSVEGGEAFVKAGVRHVIAVRREARVQDRAACVFAESFYYALLRARTVREAFDVAVQAVANGPFIVAPGNESRKFLLLPEEEAGTGSGVHDVALFHGAEDGAPTELSSPLSAHNLPAFFPLQFLGRHALWATSVAGVRQKRAVLLIGSPGVGKTALAVASAHYLLERHAFRGGAPSYAPPACPPPSAALTCARRSHLSRARILLAARAGSRRRVHGLVERHRVDRRPVPRDCPRNVRGRRARQQRRRRGQWAERRGRRAPGLCERCAAD